MMCNCVKLLIIRSAPVIIDSSAVSEFTLDNCDISFTQGEMTDKLKKRAERFGTVTSTTLTKVSGLYICEHSICGQSTHNVLTPT